MPTFGPIQSKFVDSAGTHEPAMSPPITLPNDTHKHAISAPNNDT